MSVFIKKVKSVDVRMIITEEKILSNIDKVTKLVDPKSKRKIIKLEEDAYFKDLVESITQYLTEYPNKNNFPAEVYQEAYKLVEYATEQFDLNNKEIENLIRKREENIKMSVLLKEAFDTVKLKEAYWIDKLDRYEGKFNKTIAEALTVIANESMKTKEELEAAEKVIKSKISNLESNLFIEVDMERVEDRSKALSFIGIEIAEALKKIPSPNKYSVIKIEKENINNAVKEELQENVVVKVDTNEEKQDKEESENNVVEEIEFEETKENEETIKLDSKIETESLNNNETKEAKEESFLELDEVLKEKQEEINTLAEDEEEKLKSTIRIDTIKNEIFNNENSLVDKDEKIAFSEFTLDENTGQVVLAKKEAEQNIFEETKKIEVISINNDSDLDNGYFKFIEDTRVEVKESFLGSIVNAFKSLFGIKNSNPALNEGMNGNR
ncbi:MAG: hypothetical protein HG467_001235 [Clostridiales bacterium]|nr:hypothetical protein [Clostridiales bacterium]